MLNHPSQNDKSSTHTLKLESSDLLLHPDTKRCSSILTADQSFPTEQIVHASTWRWDAATWGAAPRHPFLFPVRLIRVCFRTSSASFSSLSDQPTFTQPLSPPLSFTTASQMLFSAWNFALLHVLSPCVRVKIEVGACGAAEDFKCHV